MIHLLAAISLDGIWEKLIVAGVLGGVGFLWRICVLLGRILYQHEKRIGSLESWASVAGPRIGVFHGNRKMRESHDDEATPA